METVITTCKNCDNSFEGGFCNTCGQKADTYRITWKDLFHHLPHAIFHLDDGFFFTVKQLATRPGHALRDYLNGKRKHYFNPFLMIVLTAGFCSYLYVHYHFTTIMASVNIEHLETHNATIGHKYLALRTLFFCLVCGIGDFLFFHRHKYTLPETLISNTFVFAEISTFQILYMPLFFLGRYLNIIYFFQIFFLVLVLIYLFIVRYQFYNTTKNKWLTVKIGTVVLIYFMLMQLIGEALIKPYVHH